MFIPLDIPLNARHGTPMKIIKSMPVGFKLGQNLPSLQLSTTTDSFCTLEHKLICKVLSHSIIAAFRYDCKNKAYNGKIVVLVREDRTQVDRQNYTSSRFNVLQRDTFVNCRSSLSTDGRYQKDTKLALMSTPEGQPFTFRNMKRYRLTTDELMALLGHKTFKTFKTFKTYQTS